MKKILFFSMIVLCWAFMLGCGEKKDTGDQQAATRGYSENYKKAEKCILDYEQAVKAAKNCEDLEVATSRYYTVAARVEVTDSTELAALKVLADEAQKKFLAKYKELDCASQPEEGEE